MAQARRRLAVAVGLVGAVAGSPPGGGAPASAQVRPLVTGAVQVTDNPDPTRAHVAPWEGTNGGSAEDTYFASVHLNGPPKSEVALALEAAEDDGVPTWLLIGVGAAIGMGVAMLVLLTLGRRGSGGGRHCLGPQAGAGEDLTSGAQGLTNGMSWAPCATSRSMSPI